MGPLCSEGGGSSFEGGNFGNSGGKSFGSGLMLNKSSAHVSAVSTRDLSCQRLPPGGMVGFGNPNFDNAPKDEKDSAGTLERGPCGT